MSRARQAAPQAMSNGRAVEEGGNILILGSMAQPTRFEPCGLSYLSLPA